MSNDRQNYFGRTAEIFEILATNPPPELDQLVDTILEAWNNGGKVVSCGNGGSAADSQHFTAELVAKFSDEAIHKPALSLNVNPSTITAVSNDWSYDEVFSRQVRAQGTPDDVFIGISTSGNSKNVLKGLKEALKVGMESFALTGEDGGLLNEYNCSLINIPSNSTPHIQEGHGACLHYVCQEIDHIINK